jgi:hypothetical protein
LDNKSDVKCIYKILIIFLIKDKAVLEENLDILSKLKLGFDGKFNFKKRDNNEKYKG